MARVVWYERHDGIEAAIHREKRLKKYKRDWKINLIERDNPDWDDLFPRFFVEDGPLSACSPSNYRPDCDPQPTLTRVPANAAP